MIPFTRFRYPGQATGDRLYSGALAPTVTRRVVAASVTSRTDRDGPLFGRKVYPRARYEFDLVWSDLSHAEADMVVYEWTQGSYGASPLYYTPDDQSAPRTVHVVGSPEVAYRSAAAAAVRLTLREQR